MTRKTHWRQYLPTDFLGSPDLDNGAGGYEELVATISGVKLEEVTDNSGRRERLPVAHFEERDVKPMILNVTNSKMLEQITRSKYVEDWTGQRILISVDTNVRMPGGGRGAGLRIRPKKFDQPAPVCHDCKKVIPPHEGVDGATIGGAYKKVYGVPLCFDCGQKRKEVKTAPVRKSKAESGKTSEVERGKAVQA